MSDEDWNSKFKSKKYIWGMKESQAARIVLEDINKNSHGLSKETKIIDIGCGYGRDVNYFSQSGLTAIGIDDSEEAIVLGNEAWNGICFIREDIFTSEIQGTFDFVFCNFFIHLFLEDQRNEIINKIYSILNQDGIAYFVVSSDKDEDYMTGNVVGDHLVANKRGVVKYYYNTDLIEKEFQIFANIEIGTYSELHTHDYQHEHHNYIIKCKKMGECNG